jgi:hypothetical protein
VCSIVWSLGGTGVLGIGGVPQKVASVEDPPVGENRSLVYLRVDGAWSQTETARVDGTKPNGCGH